MRHPVTAHATPDASLVEALELLLAEKRTALSLLRTGIAVFALPLSVLSLLVATARNYRYEEVAAILLPLLVLSGSLLLLACYLVYRAVVTVHRCDRHVAELKNRSPVLAALIG